MTEQPPSAIGTVAQEAARLIEEMATMARSSKSRDDHASSYAGEPAREPPAPKAPPASAAPEDHEAAGRPFDEPCSVCGGEPDDVPASCRLCPVCRGIALLRSVRPETVDLLADLALSVAASLRDVAVRSRATDPPSSWRSSTGRPSADRSTSGTSSTGHATGADRDPVQDIPVDDEDEGPRR